VTRLDRYGDVKLVRPHPVLDRIAAGLLILAGLLYASAATYAGNLLAIVALWGLGGWAAYWLWAQYREHTRPHALSPPAQPTAHIPALVRLMLLPGAHRIVGTSNVAKARRIRFLRTDMARRALADRREAEHARHLHSGTAVTCPICDARPYGRTLPGHSRHGWM